MEREVISAELLERSPLFLAYRLVEEGKIDPWDVDLERLINEYLEEIRRRELADLTVPAKVIAFATFLIKKQLEILFPKPPRRRERKRITLQEIEREFEQTPAEEFVNIRPKGVKKSSPKKGKTEPKGQDQSPPPLHRTKLEEALRWLLSLLERERGRELPFSTYASENDYVAKLWALLNMAAEERVELRQSEPFGEIYFKGH